MDALDRWFVQEVLPHEAALTKFIKRFEVEEVEDLRQEVYARIYDAARQRIPIGVRPYLLRIARNLLIDRARRARVVSVDLVAEIDSLSVMSYEVPADEVVAGRQELKRLMAAVAQLPPRCRQVVQLRKIDGLSQRETASRLGITESTVEKQTIKGIRMLAEILFGSGSGSKSVREELGREHGRG